MSCFLDDNEDGFTIIEMVVSLAIGMLILSITLSLFYVQRNSFSIQEQLSGMQQNMRVAMDIMSREIRMAGYGTTATNIFTVSDTGTITFYRDIDDDGDADQIRFGLDNVNLEIEKKVGTASPQPFVENIETLSFTYGTDTATGATNTVAITITARTDKSDSHYKGDGYRRGTLTSVIDIRNQ